MFLYRLLRLGRLPVRLPVSSPCAGARRCLPSGQQVRNGAVRSGRGWRLAAAGVDAAAACGDGRRG